MIATLRFVNQWTRWLLYKRRQVNYEIITNYLDCSFDDRLILLLAVNSPGATLSRAHYGYSSHFEKQPERFQVSCDHWYFAQPATFGGTSRP
jgi:hypothetical protein